jgi:fumarylacetoacetase
MTLTSFVPYPENTDFPIQNIPFGVASISGNPHIATRIGDSVVDLHACVDKGLLKGSYAASFKGKEEREKKKKCDNFFIIKIKLISIDSTLNGFMALGRKAWVAARLDIQALLGKGSPLDKDASLQASVLFPASSTAMLLPATIGDYTDFYASREHATNIGSMLRDPKNPLLPNWLHIPIGYHGRASSVVVSGTPVRRPVGQVNPAADDKPPEPVLAPCRLLDFELEMGAFVGPGNDLGDPIPIGEAHDRLFGLVLLNDWSARDIQKWEYVPLGPFTAKNFATTISPWIVTMEALEPFRTAGPAHEVAPLPYLAEDKSRSAIDIDLFVTLANPADVPEPATIVKSNLKYMYWSLEQQLAHHSVGGCNMRPGDLLGTGTISGKEVDSFGSMMELSWRGSRNVGGLPESAPRKFLKDGDIVTMTASCQGNGFKIGFGECTGAVLPARPL